jgi:hypothetical protein
MGPEDLGRDASKNIRTLLKFSRIAGHCSIKKVAISGDLPFDAQAGETLELSP